MMNEGFGMGLGGGFMWFVWIVLIVAVIWLIKMTLPGDGSRNKMPDESPLEILKKRYARGEIDDEEYRRRRKQLEE
jgi:putative membrane protein